MTPKTAEEIERQAAGLRAEILACGPFEREAFIALSAALGQLRWVQGWPVERTHAEGEELGACWGVSRRLPSG